MTGTFPAVVSPIFTMNEPTKSKQKKYKFFIGIDVSRNKLDFAVIEGKTLCFHREIENKKEAVVSFINELKEMPGFKTTKALFCMEDTGFYSNHLLVSFKKLRLNFVLENALRIRNSLGLIRDKYDKIDSIRIAQYAQRNKDELKLWVPERPIMSQLKSLSTLRDRLLNLKVILKTALDEQETFITKDIQRLTHKFCERSMEAVVADLQSIDEKIVLLLESDEHLQMLTKLITSVPAIGRITATQIIICTNEFRDINEPKKFACYAGVAPFRKESGKIVRNSRVSRFANKKMKSLLHMCAMVSLQKGGELKVYFDRKTIMEGKAGMSVMNAVRNKLILRIFACVNQRRPYQKDFQRVTLEQQEGG
ncbi:MAG: hypothetical protein JWR02_1514 [Mucilaginibacter sp.]|nr:hypothetical protein [Mucilaginibacter sp.]